MTEIWSLSLTRTGIGVCALGEDMARRQYSARWPVDRRNGCWCIKTAEFQSLLIYFLSYLVQDMEVAPQALAISCPHQETACMTDDRGRPLGDVYLSAPPMMPRHIAEELCKNTPEPATFYRISFLRNIQQIRPEFGLGSDLGIYSMGALVTKWITGEASDTCQPMGVPEDFPDFEEENSELIWNALGYKRGLCAQRILPGQQCGLVSQEFCAFAQAVTGMDFSRLAGVPVYLMGTSKSALAYVCAADPLSWSVSMGWNLSFSWIADKSKRVLYEISIQEEGTESHEDQVAKEITVHPEDLTINDLTRMLADRMPLKQAPAHKPDLANYYYKTQSFGGGVELKPDLLDEETDCFREDFLHIPVGSQGVHVLYNPEYVHLLGMTPAVDLSVMEHALFEGMLFELRYWREKIPELTPGPVRLVLESPWPKASVQMVANYLQSSVYWIDENIEELSALGIGLALMRALGVSCGRPSLQAQIIEPQAALTEEHYRIYCGLRELL